MIYKYALDRIPKEQAQNLYKAYTIYEKKFGDKTSIEQVISSKRKFQYEQVIQVISCIKIGRKVLFTSLFSFYFRILKPTL